MTVQVLLALLVGFAAGLFVRSLPKAGRPRKVARRGNASLSARWLAGEAERLASAGALWPEILSTIDPNGDPALRGLLLELRGPHMFAPLTALNVVQEGCRLVLRENRSATVVDAVRAAVRSSAAVVDAWR